MYYMMALKQLKCNLLLFPFAICFIKIAFNIAMQIKVQPWKKLHIQ